MKTQILFILDRSGSMTPCAADAVGGFNAFLAEQRKEPKGKRLTLLQFDHERTFTFEKAKLKNCSDLVLNETYEPRGTTALLDAIGTGIQSIRDAEKAVVAIYTDGQENASREYKADQVRALIKEVTGKGWEVIFLAADIDTTFATQSLGMSGRKVAAVSRANIVGTMSVVSDYATSYANTGQAKASSLQDDHDKTAKSSN